ncbi:hypothetical protein ACO0LD_03150 [Undibacterium sp. Ji83W]|uniref:hypothetical protein n=1 Tax=Undibacterium sp. Ji83W TaxID=3413043 RepID=UPI003BEF9E68
MSKKQDKAGDDAGKQPDQSTLQGQQELQTQPSQDKKSDPSDQGQSAGEEGKLLEQTAAQGQQDQAVQDGATVTEQPPVNDKIESLVQALMQVTAEDINANALDVRRIVNIRTVNVPNNRRYRGGICFTDQGRPVDLDELTEEQFTAIASDPYLRRE